MKKSCALILLVFLNLSFAQKEQEGRDLVASFPAVSEGTIEHDLPSNGNYWDPDDPGWGVSVEIQKRPSVAGGFFLFMTAFFFDENNQPFWCVVTSPFDPQVDPNQWRDAQVFSNIPWAHTDQQLLVDMDVDCHSKTGGTTLGSTQHRPNQTSKITKLNLVWRTPSRLEITPEGGQTHYTKRMALHDDIVNPSLDWVMDSYWLLTSSVKVYGPTSVGGAEAGKYSVKEFDYNVKTGFESLDVSKQEAVRAFVGHQEHFVYYISTLRTSFRITTYFNFSNNLQETPYAPYNNGGGPIVVGLYLYMILS